MPDLLRVPAGGGHALVYAQYGGHANVVDPRRMALLARVAGFATLAEHAARIGTTADERAAVEADLQELARAGLLLAENAAVAGLRAAAGADEPARLAIAGIPTRARPTELERMLESFLARAAGRALELVVVDDGRSPDERAPTQAVVTAAARRHGARVLYGDAESRLAYARLLAREAGVEEALVEDALVCAHPSLTGTGAVRNALLLHAAGEPIVQLDDDTHAPLGAPPSRGEGLVCSADPPFEHWFSGPDEEPFALCEARDDLDPFAPHESVLGRSVGALARAGAVVVDGASSRFLRDVAARDGHVVGSMLGLCGDSATGSVAHYLLLDGAARARLLASEAGYRHALESRQLVRCVRAASVTDSPFCMSYGLALDGRKLLPPFMPTGRNGDGVFGMLVRRTHRDGYFGHLPWVVRHDPPERRAPLERTLGDLRRLAGNDVVCRLLAQGPVQAEHPDPGASLRTVGELLGYWGALPLPAFEELARATALRTRGRDLVIVHDTLKAHGFEPVWWAHDLRSMAMELAHAAADPRLSHPADWIDALGDADGREGFRSAVRRYGELLRAWPELWAAARELRRRGVHPARAV
jgi:hypothetical protein